MTQGIEHRAWVAAHRDVAPARLLARVDAVLAGHPQWRALGRADALAAAGEFLLRGVLAEGANEARASALDLLAADACVTWAFEVGADAPETLGARAESVMQRIAELAA